MNSTSKISVRAQSALMKEAREAFDLFDADKSNSIDAAELENVLRTVGIVASAAEVAQYIREVTPDR
jgi:Ca2+-binding EF-hand superfamily protein